MAHLAPAPELPVYRTSELTTARRCNWRWYMTYVEGWLPTRKANALWFGIGVHYALAEYYRYQGLQRGPHPAETFAKWAKNERRYARNTDEFDEERYTDLTALGETMLDGYVQKYGPEKYVHVLAREKVSEILILNPKTRRPIGVSIGAFDLVYRDLRVHTPAPRLMEHKTAKAITTGHLAMDQQAGTYDLHATQTLRHMGIITPDEVIEATLYNYLRKGKPDTRPRNQQGLYLNQDGSVSKVQPKPLFHRELVPRTELQRIAMSRSISYQMWELEQRKKGKLPIYKNPIKDCAWDCPLRDVCELHERGQGWEDLLSLTMVRGDPYADHYRKSTEGEEEAA